MPIVSFRIVAACASDTFLTTFAGGSTPRRTVALARLIVNVKWWRTDNRQSVKRKDTQINVQYCCSPDALFRLINVVRWWQISAVDGRRYTYGQIVSHVANCARSMTDLGLKHGQRVCILLPNCIEWPVAFLAILRLGAICVPFNPAATKCSLLHISWVYTDLFILLSHAAIMSDDLSNCWPRYAV